jgi:hypothetical protein
VNVGATAPVYEVTLTALVTNIGDAAATCDHIRVYLSSSGGLKSQTIGPLGIGESEEVDATWTFSGNNLPDCPEDLEARVDAPPACVDECDEGNNEDSMNLYCPGCK